MSPKDCAYIVERLAIRFMVLVADHERQLSEHRTSFGARTEADAKIIAGLRVQVQDMRAEMERLRAQMSEQEVSVVGIINERNETWERFWAEVARLKSQTPKHPVKVGEWVRRLVPSPACGMGTVAKVVHVDDDTSEIEYDVKRIDGQHGVWFAKNCEPCDPPEAMHAEPDLTHLHIKGKEAWSDVPNATQWVEEMRGNTEAAHDTDAGKAVAESAVGAEPVAEEIKVGDVVEVVSNTGRNTWLTDVGSVGTVTSIETLEDSLSVRLKAVPDKKNVCGGYVSICDVRKVTT